MHYDTYGFVSAHRVKTRLVDTHFGGEASFVAGDLTEAWPWLVCAEEEVIKRADAEHWTLTKCPALLSL